MAWWGMSQQVGYPGTAPWPRLEGAGTGGVCRHLPRAPELTQKIPARMPCQLPWHRRSKLRTRHARSSPGLNTQLQQLRIVNSPHKQNSNATVMPRNSKKSTEISHLQVWTIQSVKQEID